MDYSKLGITAINEQNPSGEDVKYDEDFELLEVEISKLTSPTGSSGIDWDKVVELSYNILDTKSKHILVATYLSYALLKKDGIEGLREGVKVLSDLIENYWETLYPPVKRIKGRINAIEWWLDKVGKELENLEALEVDEDKRVELISNLKKIDDSLNEKLDDAPLFYSLIKLLEMKLTSQVQTQDVVEDKVVEPISSPKVQTQTTTISKNVEQDFQTTVSSLNQITGQMIQAKDYRSELFIINRAFAWLDIDELPASEKNITMLSPPDTQEAELLSKLYNEKNYEDLIWAAESRVTSYLFWLDLHYYVAESLKNLNHIEASGAIYEQMLYFIKKLPNLENLSFSDSTPFASKATKKWLHSKEAKKDVSATDNKADVSIVEENSDCTMNGIDALCEKMSHCASVEEEVLYNIQICKCLIESSNSTLIYSYTQKLLETIEKYSTAKWSPKIALEAYTVCLDCLETIDDKSNSELLNSVLFKIALLKPSLIQGFAN